jgi:NTP pyrophosphatase (non-canonical NTP hydrolase)
MQISEFQSLMKNLYFKNDNERGITGTTLWFFEEIGEFSEALRHYISETDERLKEEYKDTLSLEMADIVAWLCSIANILNINLEQALFDKYPNKCPKCMKNPCICNSK